MTAKERVLRVAVVHGLFSERGDSIISIFSWEQPLICKRSCKKTNEFSG